MPASWPASKPIMKTLWLLALVVLAAGCHTPPPVHTVRFESEPPGARVFFGAGANEHLAPAKSFLGTTPCSGDFVEGDDGGFEIPRIKFYSKFTPGVMVLEARLDGVTNRIVFRGGAKFHQPPDKIPPAVFFDLKPAR